MKWTSNGPGGPALWGAARAVLVGAGVAIACFPSVGQAAAPGGDATWSATAQQPLAIEVAASVSAPMEFAASELARYLGQILGKTLAVGPAAAGAPKIVLEKVADKDLRDGTLSQRIPDEAAR